jgi:hypothetical protein
MTRMKLIAMAGAFATSAAMCTTMCASTAAFAQSSPNCGPNAPAGDTYGVPVSGSAQARAGARLCEQMAAHNGRYGWRRRGEYGYRR